MMDQLKALSWISQFVLKNDRTRGSMGECEGRIMRGAPNIWEHLKSKIKLMHLFIGTSILIGAGCSAREKVEGHIVAADTMRFEKIFILGLQGDAAEALKLLDDLNEQELTPRQRKLKGRFIERFRGQEEGYDHRTIDPVVRELIDIYRWYWRSALLDNEKIGYYDSLLIERVVPWIMVHDPLFDRLAASKSYSSELHQFLERRGVFAAVGKTGRFYDLLLHTKQTPMIYKVATVEEDSTEVKVVFMEEIISNGWQEFATFGKYFPGGWTTTDALYCVKETYDLASENFKVSYLAHEGKHFADNKRYPNLGTADLEYRAKLVELSYAQETLYDLIGFFVSNTGTDLADPHSMANHCVIRDLSRECSLQNDPLASAEWRKIPTSTINECAMLLLKEHTASLDSLGGKDVVSLIKP